MNANAQLTTLEASGLIQLASLEPELEYLFRHALVQEAAYASLLKQDRRALHRLAAETLLATYPDRQRELAGVIAMHLEQAGETRAAAEQFVVAGEHALERFAKREAMAFFERALTFLPDDDPRASLRLRAAVGVAKAGFGFIGAEAAVERLDRAIALASDQDDPRALVDALFWDTFFRRMRGETSETSPTLRQMHERASSLGDSSGDRPGGALADALEGISAAMAFGRLREGARLMSGAIDSLEATADVLSSAIVSDFLGMAYARLGEFAEAEQSLARSDRLAAEGDEIARLDATITRSAISLERGDLQQGQQLATECTIKSDQLGAVACGVAANVFLGNARIALDETDAAKPPLERGYEYALVTNMTPMRALAQGMLGSVTAELGDLAEGARHWDSALATAREVGDPYSEAVTLWNRARARSRRPEPDREAALADLDAAAQLFGAIEALPALARVLRDRSRLLMTLGRESEAHDSAEQSARLAAELQLRDFAVPST